MDRCNGGDICPSFGRFSDDSSWVTLAGLMLVDSQLAFPNVELLSPGDASGAPELRLEFEEDWELLIPASSSSLPVS
jgi:hypothetical protein